MSDRNEFKKQINAIQSEMDEANRRLDKAVINARENGLTWNEIAKEIGITRQGAWAKWASDKAAKPS